MTYRLSDEDREALARGLVSDEPDESVEAALPELVALAGLAAPAVEAIVSREVAAVEAIVSREVAAVEAAQHDDQCESEYESGAHAWTPCGCQASRSEAEGLVARAKAAEAKVAAVEALADEWGITAQDGDFVGDDDFAEAIRDSGAWRLARDLRAALGESRP